MNHQFSNPQPHEFRVKEESTLWDSSSKLSLARHRDGMFHRNASSATSRRTTEMVYLASYAARKKISRAELEDKKAVSAPKASVPVILPRQHMLQVS